ncbi:pyridoxamine 5'-phosphate oxidase family protein [Neptuniibacter halophilus]|uniref:pyridoxamine 5'-phosphate oxidase family protein n=1 Tax=Neptuniibacter halophilus TaxID=651666 RepID=UPI002572D1F4|nr:pyridoxamine 5'-phosphate oxidase family protein [Neptuniibacter halophilus]
MSEYPISSRTQLKRSPKKACYDKQQIREILDEALVCHVSTHWHGQPLVQPTIHWVDGDYLYIHGSSKNGLFQALLAGQPAAICVTLLDGLVFARSAFHHSVNYRSVMIYAQAELIDEEQEKRRQLDLLMERVREGRSLEARPANDTELKATAVLAFKLEEVSAKIRRGGPIDEAEDMQLDVWAGVQPITQVLGEIELD